MSELPLLRIQAKIPFDEISPSQVEATIEALLIKSKERLDEIISFQGQRTFKNTLLALENMTEELDFAYGIFNHLDDVKTSDELKENISKVEAKVTEFRSGIILSEGLWRAISAYAETEEAKCLKGIEKRFLELTIRDFEREGANLSPELKKELTAVKVELQTLTTKFGQNVVSDTAAFEYYIEDEAKLAGLPASAVEQAKTSAEKKGHKGWRFTLQGPSYIALMTYLDDASIREKVYRAFNSRCVGGEFDNTALIPQILKLRQRKAEILGFKNFADLVTADRMVKTAENAWKFEKDLASRVRSQFEEEKKTLLKFRRELEGSNAPDLNPWDTAYYSEKLRKALYDFDDEELRPYLSYENVLKGIFEISGRIFGISVKPLEGYPVWHESVKVFGIYEKNGNYLGNFYTDFFPREEKRGGAWMNSFLTGFPTEKGFSPHVGIIAGNFSPPTNESPSLLTHDEVTTTFHEFGHLLCQFLCKLEIKSLAGLSVPWDFVEFHSQIMENWCWEREALDLFARHYKTGETIPKDLYDKLLRARNFNSATIFMRQLGFGILDLYLHTEYEPQKDGDVIAYSRKIMQDFTTAKLDSDYGQIAGFTHLLSNPTGYAAGYYSYKWAEAIDADGYTRFQKEGIFSPATGESLLKEIFSKGHSEDPEVLFKNFMGRELDTNALLLRSGIV